MSDQQRRKVLSVDLEDGVVIPGLSNALGFVGSSTVSARPRQKNKEGITTDYGVRIEQVAPVTAPLVVSIDYGRKDGAGKWVLSTRVVMAEQITLEPLSDQ